MSTVADSIIAVLQAANNTGNKTPRIGLRFFCNAANKLAALVQALRTNNEITHLVFSFRDSNDLEMVDGAAPPLSYWDPLLNELATREKLETVEIYFAPTGGHLLPLFRDQFFQALQQRTKHLESLELNFVEFSRNNSEGVVSYLLGGGALSSPTHLRLYSCTEVQRISGAAASPAAGSVTSVLRHSAQLQRLTITNCREGFVSDIFRSLAYFDDDNYASGLAEVVIESIEPDLDPRELPYLEVMGQYFESPRATIQSLTMRSVCFDNTLGFSRLSQGLIQSASVKELVFYSCYFQGEEEDEGDANREQLQYLADLVRNKSNLSILRAQFFDMEEFCDAVIEVLGQRASPLRCLDIEYPNNLMFRELVKAVARSTGLEQVAINAIYFDPHIPPSGNFGTLFNQIRSLKVAELKLDFMMGSEADAQELVMGAL